MSEEIKFRQLKSVDDPQFDLVTRHQYEWWGGEFGMNEDQVFDYMEHMLGENVPYTFVMERGDTLIGFYQVKPSDLFVRPDLGPWFANAYILPEHRGCGHFRAMNAAAIQHAQEKGIPKIYLHTRHEGLYEKFGWKVVESSDQYKTDGIRRWIYECDLTQDVV